MSPRYKESLLKKARVKGILAAEIIKITCAKFQSYVGKCRNPNINVDMVTAIIKDLCVPPNKFAIIISIIIVINSSPRSIGIVLRSPKAVIPFATGLEFGVLPNNILVIRIPVPAKI